MRPFEPARPAPRQLARDELAGVGGVVVVIDVLRAFTTAAYALGGGASAIHLVSGLEEAVTLGRSIPNALVVGEDHGRMPPEFDLPNSPYLVSLADVAGRELVLRTGSGTQGVVAALDADHLFAAALVNASATAAAVDACGAGDPTYVLSGRLPDWAADDDRLVADHIEARRTGAPADDLAVAAALTATPEAYRTLTVGEGNMDPLDVVLAAEVDRFDFAMAVHRRDGRLTILAE